MVAEGADYWMPMDQYIGGIEHAILHLLYARFWTKVMRDLGLVKVDEPFSKLLTQGMVLNHIYSRRTEKGGKDYFWPQDVEHVFDEAGKVIGAKLIKAVGDLPVGTAIDYEGVGTMSKSKNNGVDPQDLIEKYGADTARLYTMFTAPPEATLEWNDAAVEGSYRFMKRVWGFGSKLSATPGLGALAASVGTQPLSKAAKALRLEVHTVLKQVDYDYQRMQYNTVVSGAMKMLNALDDFKGDGSAGDNAALAEGFGILLRALYPATPHIAHACGPNSVTPRPRASCSTRPGPRPTNRRCDATRSNWCCRSTASCVAASPCRLAPTRPPSRPRPWPATPSSRPPMAPPPRRWWSCPAGW